MSRVGQTWMLRWIGNRQNDEMEVKKKSVGSRMATPFYQNRLIRWRQLELRGDFVSSYRRANLSLGLWRRRNTWSSSPSQVPQKGAHSGVDWPGNVIGPMGLHRFGSVAPASACPSAAQQTHQTRPQTAGTGQKQLIEEAGGANGNFHSKPKSWFKLWRIRTLTFSFFRFARAPCSSLFLPQNPRPNEQSKAIMLRTVYRLLFQFHTSILLRAYSRSEDITKELDSVQPCTFPCAALRSRVDSTISPSFHVPSDNFPMTPTGPLPVLSRNQEETT